MGIRTGGGKRRNMTALSQVRSRFVTIRLVAGRKGQISDDHRRLCRLGGQQSSMADLMSLDNSIFDFQRTSQAAFGEEQVLGQPGIAFWYRMYVLISPKATRGYPESK